MARLNNEQVIRRLFEISTEHGRGFAHQVRSMLQVGCERFRLEIGLVARVRGDAFEVLHVHAPPLYALAAGDVLPLAETLAQAPLRQGGPIGYPDLAASELRVLPAHTHRRLRAYFGAPVVSAGVPFGTLSFSSRETRRRPFSRADHDLLALMAAWLGTEMTRLKEEADLRRAEESFRLGIEASPTAMIMVDDCGQISYANREALRLFGYQAADLVGQAIEILVPDADRAGHRGLRGDFQRQPQVRDMSGRPDLRARARDGREFPVAVGLNPIDTPYGSFILCTVTDQTERRRFEQRIVEQTEKLQRINRTLSEQAISDSLTGLANRRGLFGPLETILRLAARSRQATSLLMIDVDRFKDFNDTFGHQEGDRALRALGRILQETARRSDVAARYGGEEFVLVLPETGPEGAREVAQRVREAVSALSSLPRRVTVSIGVATLVEAPPPVQAADLADRLIRQADEALYRAKRGGRDRVVHHDDIV